ncbi:FecR domain-containing protein [Dyadobacter jiangsuensis]|uniref:FecR family protein n=1 Tax=Dyadobacter jiangsuensis TaxID=1591085 RepID=A0A2P8GB18_9BACT|nr:FecR domain-containing protein [Dyadobacter jiangsuensis]PSL31167.1 FecR family protein [Dyadobacter jiangsuensis]
MSESELTDLLRRFREGTCTEEEKELLELWFDQTSVRSDWKWTDTQAREHTRQQMLNSIQMQIRETDRKPRRLWPYLSAAASVALLLVAGAWWFIYSGNGRDRAADYSQTAVKPGTQQAMLTLSDGSSVLVDGAARGVLSKDGDMTVLKTDQGNLEYRKDSDGQASDGRNTLLVPRGSTFKVTLPDGTVAWINSATRMTYPAGNTGSERLVELSGEAYFEVRPDKKRPFRVLSGGTEITVTGTHFNVNAYEDEKDVITTLAEGQVLVGREGKQAVLKPGQQALSNDSGKLTVREVDVEGTLAWKEGYFVFDDMELRSVMKMIARWYDVEVVYEGDIPPRRFGGTFSKSKDLGGLLSYLGQLSNIHFKQQGKKIMVKQ